jgi:hypothetical protein
VIEEIGDTPKKGILASKAAAPGLYESEDAKPEPCVESEDDAEISPEESVETSDADAPAQFDRCADVPVAPPAPPSRSVSSVRAGYSPAWPGADMFGEAASATRPAAPQPTAPAIQPAPARAAVPVPTAAFPSPAQPAQSEPTKRKTSVRYYEQMNPQKSYPLMVAFSKEAIKKAKLDKVQQTTGQKVLSVKKEHPEVSVTPCLSGCLVIPPMLVVDVTPEIASAEFWVTPVMEGPINGWIDVSYQGKNVEKIPLKTKSVKQTIAKIGAFGAVVSPMVSFVLDGFQVDMSQQALRGLPLLASWIQNSVGLYLFGFACMAAFFGVGLYFYFRNRPKEAEILEKFFTAKPQENE